MAPEQRDRADRRLRITGVIVARNEADKVAYALRSVQPMVDEVLFYDMESSDGTATIAAGFGAKVTSVPLAPWQDPVRPLAVAEATGDWVLMFDADEVLEPKLCKTLLRIVRNDEADAVSLPRFNYLFGKPMQGARMGANDDRQIRFFKKGSLEVSSEIHQQACLQPGMRLKELSYPQDGAMVHFNYVDIDNYLTKFIRYTSMESQTPAVAAKYTLGGTFLRMGWEFFNRYLRKGGYRDGWRGLYVSLAMGFYRLTIWARVHQLQEFGSRERIEHVYRTEAERVLHNPS